MGDQDQKETKSSASAGAPGEVGPPPEAITRHASHPLAGTPASKALTTDSLTKRYWFIEIWEWIREPFIAITSHTILFGFVIGIIRLAGYLIEHSGLEPERKANLEKIDYYLWIIVLVMLGIALLFDLLIHSAYDIERKWQDGRKK
jgi:hypothetical protein